MRERPPARRLRNRAVRLAAAVAVTCTLGTAVAYAYWATTGAAAGSAATTGTITIAAAALSGETPNSALIPGGSADALVKVSNPNAFPVQVIGITATGNPQAGNGCAPTGVSFTAPAGFTDPQFTLPAHQSTVLHLAGAMSMSTASATACQGQTFSLPLTVTVRT